MLDIISSLKDLFPQTKEPNRCMPDSDERLDVFTHLNLSSVMVTLAIGARYEGGSSPAVPFRWEIKVDSCLLVCQLWLLGSCQLPSIFLHVTRVCLRHRKTMKPSSKPHMYDRCIVAFCRLTLSLERNIGPC